MDGATVIEELPLVPADVLTVVGLAEVVKSLIVTVTVAVWLSEPLAPETVTL